MKKKTDKSRKNGTKGYRIIRGLFGWCIRLFSRIHVYGAENEPNALQGPYLLVCNHLQWCDPIWLCVSLKWQQPHYMAKKETFRVPILGSLIRSLGAYPVDRGGADVAAIKKTIHLLENGTTVGMFPQGHRRRGQNPRDTEVRPGAAMIAIRANVPVLPVLIRTNNYNPRPFQRVDVIIGKPIPPEELHYQKDVSGEYARISRYIFDKLCDLENTDVSEKHP